MEGTHFICYVGDHTGSIPIMKISLHVQIHKWVTKYLFANEKKIFNEIKYVTEIKYINFVNWVS